MEPAEQVVRQWEYMVNFHADRAGLVYPFDFRIVSVGPSPFDNDTALGSYRIYNIRVGFFVSGLRGGHPFRVSVPPRLGNSLSSIGVLSIPFRGSLFSGAFVSDAGVDARYAASASNITFGDVPMDTGLTSVKPLKASGARLFS